MMRRLTSAMLRAFLVVLLIATPALMLPGVSSDSTQIVAFVAIFGAALVIFEYASVYPGLVEFRDAPPFNRIRFAGLFAMVAVLALMVRGQTSPSMLSDLFLAFGAVAGSWLDFPYSPVRLVVLMLPETAVWSHVLLVRDVAAVAYLVAMGSLAAFVVQVRLLGWPLRRGSFNVWVNLPTFDPTAGGDVVRRLEKEARVNVALGFLLPFLAPAVVKAATFVLGAVTLDNPHTMIWTVAAWAFLPASLFMRGIAMQRIASLISAKRQREATYGTDDYATA
ncbi:MAG: hypothetical protein MUF73_12905 [Rhodobacteraceae bacterium]|jgi:hypothetical protein|nr:hypothetical protein [Paracoccaceae bacterium]